MSYSSIQNYLNKEIAILAASQVKDKIKINKINEIISLPKKLEECLKTEQLCNEGEIVSKSSLSVQQYKPRKMTISKPQNKKFLNEIGFFDFEGKILNRDKAINNSILPRLKYLLNNNIIVTIPSDFLFIKTGNMSFGINPQILKDNKYTKNSAYLLGGSESNNIEYY
jgi:hypothetical protein